MEAIEARAPRSSGALGFRSAILYFVNRSRSGTFGLPASAVEDMGGDSVALLGFDLIDEG